MSNHDRCQADYDRLWNRIMDLIGEHVGREQALREEHARVLRWQDRRIRELEKALDRARARKED